ncbi:hypothetical protein COCNU_scaffold001104G000010 [Cocos nucifera]|nr:hypothetical protein [Cocos nucifera]
MGKVRSGWRAQGHGVGGIGRVEAIAGEAGSRWQAQGQGIGGTGEVGVAIEEAGPGWLARSHGIGGIDWVEATTGEVRLRQWGRDDHGQGEANAASLGQPHRSIDELEREGVEVVGSGLWHRRHQ